MIVQPYVPRYRAPFYQRSRQALARTGIDLHVVVGRQCSDRNDVDGAFEARIAEDHVEQWTRGQLRWRGLRNLHLGPRDLLLLEHAIKNLDLYPALLRKGVWGPSVGLWGHGRAYSSVQGPVLRRWKEFVTCRTDWFFAYTADGARSVIGNGFPAARTTVLNNTLDTDALRRDLAGIGELESSRWAQSLSIDPQFAALFLGGVDGRKDVEFLMQAAQAAAQLEPRFVLLVGGSGADLDRIRRAEQCGAPVRTLDRLDGPRKALALKTASLLAIPSQIGLVAVDSLVAALPIVTRSDRLHGPEAQYLTDGSDSVWLPRDASPEEYAAQLVSLMRDQDRLSPLQVGCRKKAPLHTLDAMVSAFAEGVGSWAEVTRYGL